jgi:hypothetical protein
MAALRPVEERDAKGNIVRLNPSILFKQDQQIRKVRGRHDWDLLDNPHYHQPITAQVQNGNFFSGTPESTQSRTFAKEIPVAKVAEIAPYIIDNLKKNPIRVREARPMVYEVRVANLDGQEVPVAEEVDTHGAAAITVTPTVPERYEGERSGAPHTVSVE